MSREELDTLVSEVMENLCYQGMCGRCKFTSEFCHTLIKGKKEVLEGIKNGQA